MASENYFELFGLSPLYALDSAALEQTWRTLAARVHPDRYATATPAERRVAMQWASTINEAYRVLKTPLNRARYLCEQAGCDLQTENNTRMDGAFLMRQMEWREQLDEARELHRDSAFAALENDIRDAQAQMNEAITALIDQQHDYEHASQKVREWMFIEKLAQEVQSSRNDLTDRQH
ncbi:MAG TPA: Fe-S protein assembly co-chaperone HscB [Eoetvoesiella sp.]